MINSARLVCASKNGISIILLTCVPLQLDGDTKLLPNFAYRDGHDGECVAIAVT